MMTSEEIIEKAKKTKRFENKWAPYMIGVGIILLGLILYLAYDMRNLFSFFSNLFDINTICKATEEEAEEYFKIVIMLTGILSFVIYSAFHNAISLIINGIAYLKGNKERDLLISIFEKTKGT